MHLLVFLVSYTEFEQNTTYLVRGKGVVKINHRGALWVSKQYEIYLRHFWAQYEVLMYFPIKILGKM